jgi:Xaa-Pro aminopeptidase
MRSSGAFPIVAILAVWSVGAVASENPYSERRERLMAALPDGLILVRAAGRDGRVNPNFLYLTGVSEPGGALLLAPGRTRIETYRRYPGRDYIRGRMVRQILFLPGRDPLAARWGEDAAVTAQAADREALGVDAVFAADELDEVLSRALTGAEVLHVVRSRVPALSPEPDPDAQFVDRLSRRFFGLTVTDATDRVHDLRRVKDREEVRKIQEAVDVVGEGHARIMRMVRPGLREYQLEAELEHAWRSRGGTPAFPTIVASGPNAVLLHYRAGDRELEDGELVLVDAGANIDGYRSDVTRTIPVNGTFTPRQREIYEVVLRAQDAAMALCRPGALMENIHSAAYDVIAEAGFGSYFIHGTSHYLGLETHDAGDVYEPLEPGVVLTVEPGIYIPEEGIGVRIEDVVLVTGDGFRNLSGEIPRTVEDIERAMRSR